MVTRKQIGAYAIPNGADSGFITGLQLVDEPTIAFVSVRKPSGGLNLSASAFNLTLDGFTFNLSGQTDSDKYILDFQIIT